MVPPSGGPEKAPCRSLSTGSVMGRWHQILPLKITHNCHSQGLSVTGTKSRLVSGTHGLICRLWTLLQSRVLPLTSQPYLPTFLLSLKPSLPRSLYSGSLLQGAGIDPDKSLCLVILPLYLLLKGPGSPTGKMKWGLDIYLRHLEHRKCQVRYLLCLVGSLGGVTLGVASFWLPVLTLARCVIRSSIPFCIPSLCFALISWHASPFYSSTLASSLFLEHTKHTPTSGPLYLLFTLHFPDISLVLSQSIQSSI